MGYVGLVGCGVLSEHHRTFYYDIDQTKMTKLKNNEIYIKEPELGELYKKGSNCPEPLQSISEMVRRCQIIFVTVGTPSGDDGAVNTDYVMSVARDLGKALAINPRGYYGNISIILKSTVPPTTTRDFAIMLNNYRAQDKYELLYSPEFLAEGRAVLDMKIPDKVVIGSYKEKPISENVTTMFEKMYGEKEFRKLLVHTSWENAEMIKYANNAFLATKITFINQIANICENVRNTDVNVIAKALGKDSRISPRFLKAGLGYGGSCFTKDIAGIVNFADNIESNSYLLKTINKINMGRRFVPVLLAGKVWKSFENKTVAVLGISFKPNTDDIRDAPAIDIIKSFLELGVKVNVYDPEADQEAFKREFLGNGSNLVRCPSAKYALKNSDMAILVTEWDEFGILEADDFILLMNEPFVFDGRRQIINPERLISKGVKYYGIGYGNNNAINGNY